MSVDVEEWYQTENLKPAINRKDWNLMESRVEDQIDILLEIFKRKNIKATFFVLGLIAEKHPEMIKKIHNNGHEIASHGYTHKLLHELSHEQFKEEVINSKKILENITKSEVKGYRAPAFTIRRELFHPLFEAGYKYDASYMPTSMHDRYGKLKDSQIYNINNFDGVLSFPNLAVKMFGITIPISGGGYFRLFPYSLFKVLFKKAAKKAELPIFYIHPWEIDYKQPKVKNISRFASFRHYIGLKRTLGKLEKLTKDFKFISFSEYFEANEIYKRGEIF